MGTCPTRLGEELDPTLYVVEAPAMGLSDLLLGWILPASALLMILHHPFRPHLALIGSGVFIYFSALIGSGVFIYFSALIILSRVYLKREGMKVGRPASERAAYLFGGMWIACSLAMISLAIAALSR
jgi:hypothetical protein